MCVQYPEKNMTLFSGTYYESYHHTAFLVELVGYLMLYPVGNRGILFRSAGDKSEKAKEYI